MYGQSQPEVFTNSLFVREFPRKCANGILNFISRISQAKRIGEKRGIHMAGEKEYNLYTAAGFAGKYTLAQLRQKAQRGELSRDWRVGEVLEPGGQHPSVLITSLPELADLHGQLAVPAGTPAEMMQWAAESEPEITRGSAWYTFFMVLGCFSLGVGSIGTLMALGYGNGSMAIKLFADGVGGAILFFFLAFLVDVLTDIRWFLKNLSDNVQHDIKSES